MRDDLAELLALAERQHGVLTAEQCARWLTRHQLRRLLTLGILERVRRGIYRVRGTPATWRQQLMVEVFAAGATAAVSHESAGALLGARGFRPGPLFVTRQGAPPSRAPLRGRLRVIVASRSPRSNHRQHPGHHRGAARVRPLPQVARRTGGAGAR